MNVTFTSRALQVRTDFALEFGEPYAAADAYVRVLVVTHNVIIISKVHLGPDKVTPECVIHSRTLLGRGSVIQDIFVSS